MRRTLHIFILRARIEPLRRRASSFWFRGGGGCDVGILGAETQLRGGRGMLQMCELVLGEIYLCDSCMFIQARGGWGGISGKASWRRYSLSWMLRQEEEEEEAMPSCCKWV